MALAAKVAVEAYTGLSLSPHVIQIGGAPTMAETREAMLARLHLSPGSERYGISIEHLVALQTYRASHIRWTVLTPPQDIQGWKLGSPPQPHRTGAYRVSTSELVRDANGHSAVNIADLAVAAADEAEHPRFIGKRFTVGYQLHRRRDRIRAVPCSGPCLAPEHQVRPFLAERAGRPAKCRD